MCEQRASVLLTGFGPFPGMPDNASARLVEALSSRARIAFPEIETNAAILPTEWNAAPERLAHLIAAHRPSLILHFGVAPDASGFRIETHAHNACHATEDAAGLLPASEWLLRGGAQSHAATLPAGAIVAGLTKLGLPAALSMDAGGYLCNAIFYLSLTYARGANHPCRAGFIHIPADLSSPPLSFDAALTGALEILRVCLATNAVNA